MFLVTIIRGIQDRDGDFRFVIPKSIAAAAAHASDGLSDFLVGDVGKAAQPSGAKEFQACFGSTNVSLTAVDQCVRGPDGLSVDQV